MARRVKFRIKLTPRKGQTAGKRKTLGRLKKAIQKYGVGTFGGDFVKLAELAEQGQVKTGTFSNLLRFKSEPPASNLAKLSTAYKKAWQNRYRKIESGYTPTKRWTQWKARHQGRYPYTGSQTIQDTRTARMTNHLYSSIEDSFDRLRDTNQVKFSNLMLIGGMTFDPDAYPKRVSPYRGYSRPQSDGGRSYAWYDTYSYVRRFMRYLWKQGLIGSPDSPRPPRDAFLDFDQKDWNNIALAMQRIIQKQFVEPLADFFEDDLDIEVT